MTTYLEGIDVSYAQTSTPIVAGEAFVIAKASEGNFPDDQYANHANAVASHAGVVLGAYHFGRTEWTPQVQADEFLATAVGALFLALDYERAVNGTLMTEAQAREFISLVKARDQRPMGLYGSEYNPWPAFPADCWGADYAWIANTSREPTHRYTFWQYTFTPLDRDRFRGDQAAFAAFLGRPKGGVDSMVNRSGYPKNLAVKKGDPFYATAGDTTPLGHQSADATIAVQGRVIAPGGGWYLAWEDTGAGYPDGTTRPSGVYLHLTEPVAWH